MSKAGAVRRENVSSRGSPRLRFRLSGSLILVFVLLAVFLILYSMFLVYIRPNEFGIKKVKIPLPGMSRGIQETPYTTGLHFILPFGFQEMHRLPRDLQVLELTNNRESASRDSRIESAAHIQTSDGFFVNVDISIIYRIADPYMVFTKIGGGKRYIDQGIIPKAEPKLKESLGELTTEEFYNSPLRVEKTLKARERLNAELKELGLHVEYVLVRYFKYSDEIQRNIEEKKLKDQLVFKNQAEARAAAEEAILKKIVQEGEAIVSVKLEEGKAYVTKRSAEKDLYARKKKAEADLLVKLAEAKSLSLRNDALRGGGSERLVGLKMAEVLEGLEVLVLSSDGPSGLNPLDLRKTLNLFDVRKGGAR